MSRASRPFERTRAKSDDVRAVQDNTEQALRDMDGPILNGRLIQNVVLVSGVAKVVSHGLGRSPSWIVCGKTATADIWDEQAQNVTPRRTLRLLSDADVTIQLWVF